MWAPSTWHARVRLWERFQAFCRAKGLPATDRSAALFVVSTGVLPASQLTYAKALREMLKPRDALSTLMSGLAGAGANIPTRQADPISVEQLTAFIAAQPPDVAAGLRLAWKTASRWDEITKLQRRDFLLVTPAKVVLDFSTKTKGTRTDPHRASRFAVITGEWTAEIAAYLSRLRRLDSITSCPTRKLIAKLHAAFPDRPHITAHSLKRGALNRLLPLVADGTMEFAEVSRLAKHRDRLHDPLATTIRYFKPSVALADALRTGRTTRRL